MRERNDDKEQLMADLKRRRMFSSPVSYCGYYYYQCCIS